MDHSIPVSAHAVLRYMTRILKLKLATLPERRDGLGNEKLAVLAARHHGRTAAALQREICPPELESAVRGGAARISRTGFCLICDRGIVVTVVERKATRRRIMQRKELRKMRSRQDRRKRAGVA